jgi:hypothetical protein
VEPNNDAAKATPFTKGVCGTVSAPGDVDYVTVTLPMTATTLSWTYTGAVAMQVTANGTPAAMTNIPVIPGGTYVFAIQADPNFASPYPRSYRFQVQ